MTFRILNILQDGKWLPMINYINDLENVFTVITGRNSSGKSRLLSKAINAAIFKEGNLIDFQLLLMQIKIKISLGIILIMESKTQKIRSMKLLRIFY